MAGGRKKLYVVTQPESARGLYETWEACRAAVSGVRGARYQAVASREAAEALLRGDGIRLLPGRYAFVDGNHMGGVGIVLVTQGPDGPTDIREIGATVYEVFGRAGIPGLGSRPAITAAADRLRNVLAELGALFRALQLLPAGAAVTVVHDYEGLGAWLEGRWQARDPLVKSIVAACRAVIDARRLAVTFQRQRGHESSFAGPNDPARYNARADRLAAEAALRG